MSLQTLLMPLVTERLFARERLLAQRRREERRRIRRGEPHRVHYFHQVDDPYSALVAAALPGLLARYDVELVPHVVGPPSDAAAPEREKLVAYGRRDAALVARHFGLAFQDPGAQPSPMAVERATGLLLGAVDAGLFIEVAGPVSARLWGAQAVETEAPWPAAELGVLTGRAVASRLEAAAALRRRLGHYLGATLYYAGEWYWGLDRLHHLEQRLQALGADRAGGAAPLYPLAADPTEPLEGRGGPPLEFFFSLRSPYSAIVAPRVFTLGRLVGAEVRLRYVLPMVMRGLPVPREKRSYITHDAAREAFVRGVPFGRICDPLGRPTERGLALIPLAERLGLGERFVLSFLHGVWAEGVDAGSDRGLRRIAERAGLEWGAARAALGDEAWRDAAEANRQALFARGLWGVPSFVVGDTAVWGQDRLWAVADRWYPRASAP